MRDIKIPGVLWVIGIALAIFLIENFLPPELQPYGPIVVIVIMAAAKANNLGTKEIEELLAILRGIKGNQVRAARAERGIEGTIVVPDPAIEKYEPNKLMRFLLG